MQLFSKQINEQSAFLHVFEPFYLNYFHISKLKYNFQNFVKRPIVNILSFKEINFISHLCHSCLFNHLK